MRRIDPVGSDLRLFQCPNCSCLDRERHLILYFKALDLFRSFSGRKILHIAPERTLTPRIAAQAPLLYVLGDLCPASSDIIPIDIQDTTFEANTFDAVICNHVLEHVSDLARALAELRRILRPEGRLVCQTPYSRLLSRTFEEPRLQSPEDRLFFYGQADHVRLFGSDIAAVLWQAGFAGQMRSHDELLPTHGGEECGVNVREPFFDFQRA